MPLRFRLAFKCSHRKWKWLGASIYLKKKSKSRKVKVGV